MILNRQKILLLMLNKAGGWASRTQLMKWSFLLAKETASQGGTSFYKFLPYHYGPFSFSLYQEVDTLIRRGIVENIDSKRWKLASTATLINLSLPESIFRDVSYIINRYGQLSASKLSESIYARYAWYTVNSAAKEKRSQNRPVADSAVYTLGYEKLTIDGFLNVLMENGIQRVIDVRNNPISRQYGFHKGTLARLCSRLKIDYCHFPELGIPSESRHNLVSLSDYTRLFEHYQSVLLSKQTVTIQKASQLLGEKPSVLVCMEANPTFCHRSHLANVISQNTSLPVVHLGWPR